MTKIALLDYGMGNLHSAAKALEHVGADVVVTNDPKKIDAADKILFPGVGAMRDCMAGMKEAGVDDAVKRNVFNKPTMAICVGMQALFETSQESTQETTKDTQGVDCLGILGGSVLRFADGLTDQHGDTIKIPHMGWNQVHQSTVKEVDTAHFLWRDIPEQSRFYFVHSYYCQPTDSSITAATCDYGLEFTCSILKDNLFAVQFHPEKSHKAGLQLLKNFVEWRI